MSSPEYSPYEILNVAPDASLEEIAAAYRRLAQQYHPDKVAGLAPEFRDLAESKMRLINAAYEQVKNGTYIPPIAIPEQPTYQPPDPEPAPISDESIPIRPRRRRRPQRDLVQTFALWWAGIFACALCATATAALLYALRIWK